MPPIRSTTFKHYTYIIALILLLSKIIFTYSYYIKKGLVYIVITAPSSHQPSSCAKYIKANICSSYNIYSVSNTKCICLLTLYSYLVP